MEDNPVYKVLNPIPEIKLGKTSGVLQTTKHPFDREVKGQHQVIDYFFLSTLGGF